MRSTIEREEEEVDSEITLSATTLLGIFFGLVLICGVFFGFGYSSGRRGGETTKITTPAPDQNPAPAASSTPKPSAMETLEPAASTASQDTNTVSESLDEDSAPAARPAEQPKPAALIASAPPSVSPPEVRPAAMTTPVHPAAPGSGSVMVQIAAVSRSEDANALAAVLRQRGYNVVVRNEPQDQLLHVQVGPYASRDEAKAMRAKLLSDGYNAILKP